MASASLRRRPAHTPSSPRKRGSSIPENPKLKRKAAAYWIVRSSRTMIVETRRDLLPLPACGERVGVRGTLGTAGLAESPPHPETSLRAASDLSPQAGRGKQKRRMLFHPSSPSLPRRDDLDLVAGLKRRLRPPAARQHVVIQRDREMRALIFEFAEQRVDAA